MPYKGMTGGGNAARNNRRAARRLAEGLGPRGPGDWGVNAKARPRQSLGGRPGNEDVALSESGAWVPRGSPAFYGLPPVCTAAEIQRWERQERFLRAYARVGTLHGACTESGVQYATQAYWAEVNLWSFRDRLREAQEAYTARWESLMDERLSDPKSNRGSDILLMFKLKALRPEKYRDTVNISDTHTLVATLKALDRLGAMNRKPAELVAPVVEAVYHERSEVQAEPEGGPKP